MKIQLIQGQFNSKDALEIITKMIHIKIKFQEDKIKDSANEEDIKMRETRIKKLQKELFETRKFLDHKGEKLKIECEINLS